MEWTQIKSGAWLGFDGDQLHCIVEKIEDLPVEGWQPNMLQDAYTTPEAAMKKAEVILQRIAAHEATHDRPPTPPYAFLLPMLKALVTLLEAGGDLDIRLKTPPVVPQAVTE